MLRIKSKGKSVFILHILPSALKIMPFTSPFTITIHSSKQPTQQFLLQVYQYTSFSCVLTEKGVEEKNKPCEKNHSPLTYILNFKNEKNNNIIVVWITSILLNLIILKYAFFFYCGISFTVTKFSKFKNINWGCLSVTEIDRSKKYLNIFFFCIHNFTYELK